MDLRSESYPGQQFTEDLYQNAANFEDCHMNKIVTRRMMKRISEFIAEENKATFYVNLEKHFKDKQMEEEFNSIIQCKKKDRYKD